MKFNWWAQDNETETDLQTCGAVEVDCFKLCWYSWRLWVVQLHSVWRLLICSYFHPEQKLNDSSKTKVFMHHCMQMEKKYPVISSLLLTMINNTTVPQTTEINLNHRRASLWLYCRMTSLALTGAGKYQQYSVNLSKPFCNSI